MLPKVFTPQFLKRLEQFRIRSKKSFLGNRSGGHQSLKRGHGIEFSDYRKYSLGDNPRHIDWGVYARSDRLFVKQFREEQDLPFFLLLDNSASMLLPEHQSKWELAKNIALTLSYIVFMQQDSLKAAVLGAWVSPQYSGAKAIHQFHAQLESTSPSPNFELVSAMQKAVSHFSFPGKAILISDLLMPLDSIKQAVNIMRAKNLDISVIQILAPQDVRPFENASSATLLDSETGQEIQLRFNANTRQEYAKIFREHDEKIRKFLSENQIQFCSILSDQDLFEFMHRHLTQIGLLH